MCAPDPPSSTTSTVTTKSEIPEWLKPYVEELYKKGKDFTEANTQLSPQQIAVNDFYKGQLTDSQNAMNAQALANSGMAGDIIAGRYNSNIQPVDNATLPESIAYQNALASQSGYQDANVAQSPTYQDALANQLATPFSPVSASNYSGSMPSSTAFNQQGYSGIGAINGISYDPSVVDSNIKAGNIDISKAMKADNINNASFRSAKAQQTDDYNKVAATKMQSQDGYKATDSNVPQWLKNVVNAQGSNIGAALSSPYEQATGMTADTALSDLINGRSSQGTLDPTNALSKILQGTADNPYLRSMNQANIDQAMQGYRDAIQEMNQQIMPSINNDAFASGQYGGSRQGIAQGLAMQQAERNARDLSIAAMNSGNNLYGNAYESAQQRMAAAAGELNQQGAQNQQFNASNQNALNQFNAGQFNDMAKFNAANNLQNNQFNAQQRQSANQFNAANNLDLSKFNAQNQNELNALRYQNELQNNQFNAQNDTQASQFNAQQQFNRDQFNAQTVNDIALANAANKLQSQQFNTAAQNDMLRFNAQNAMANSQFNQGQRNQMLANDANLYAQLAGQNVQNALDASKFNTSTNAQNQQFNAQNAFDASKFNQSNALNALQFDASNALQNQQFNATNDLQNQQYLYGQQMQNNQFMDTQANNIALANAQNQMNYDQYNANALNDLSKFNASNNLQNQQFNTSTLNNMAQFNASNNMQNSQYNTGQLNDFAKFNAANNLQNQQYLYGQGVQNNQFNANLGVTNNQQALDQSKQNFANTMAGNELQRMNLQDQLSGQNYIYNQRNSLTNYGLNREIDMLNLMSSMIGMGGNFGGTTTGTQPYYYGGGGSIFGQALGAGAAGLGAYGLFK
jgi:hypothetical protein